MTKTRKAKILWYKIILNIAYNQKCLESQEKL